MEPPCISPDGHPWDMAYGLDGPGTIGSFALTDIAYEQHCTRPGCFAIRCIVLRDKPKDPNMERPIVLYYGALCMKGVDAHIRRYGEP